MPQLSMMDEDSSLLLDSLFFLLAAFSTNHKCLFIQAVSCNYTLQNIK